MRALLPVFVSVLAMQANAAETVMVCNAEYNSKRYYKLITPFLFGDDRVERKESGQWIDWCEGLNCLFEEVYDSGARFVVQDKLKSERNEPEYGIKKNESYYRLSYYTIDFEFGTRELHRRYFKADKRTEFVRQTALRNPITFECEIE